MIDNIVFILEEKSAKALLENMLPRLFHEINYNIQYITFSGKQDLLKNIEGKILGWKVPNTLFFVLCDKDNDDCIELKQKRLSKCRNHSSEQQSVIRIACRELETFYLGDLEAVENALNARDIKRHQLNKNCRNPDEMQGKPSDYLNQLTGNAYQKTAGSREIGKHIQLEVGINKSTCFNYFISALKNLRN
ncbi:MAG: DUF4276 family protein [bacterium]